MTFGQRASELAGFATSLLCWRPDEFWKSTPDELAAALGLDDRSSGEIGRDQLARLQALFPDKRDK